MLRLAVRVPAERAEVVLAEMLDLAPGGVEERDVGDDAVEFAVYGAPGELPALPALTAAAGDALIEVRTEEIADDWDRRWREFHRPLVLPGRLTVRPPWVPPGAAPVELVIDPGQAFGTGAHATTRLCLELVLELEPAGGFLDLGSGSGVLAIAAARLGFAPVIAIDSERASVDATTANARANGVEVDARRLDLRVDPLPNAPTVAANLLAPLLLQWASRLVESHVSPRRVIAGGLLTGECDEVADAFSNAGLAETARRESGEWAALLLERRARVDSQR